MLIGTLALLCVTHVAHGQLREISGDDSADIRETTKRVLDSPEYDRLRNLLAPEVKKEKEPEKPPPKSWWEDLVDFDAPKMNMGAGLSQVFVGLAYVCVAIVVVLILYLVVKAIIAARARAKTDSGESSPHLQGELEPEHAPGELPADVYIEAARKLAAEGRFREAVAQLLLGAMSHIERAGWIRFRRGLTHRDYLRAVRSHDVPHTALRDMVSTYEPLGFGRRTATHDHFAQSLHNYETGFRAIPEASAN